MRVMANTSPVKYNSVMTIRTDPEFAEAVDDIRALMKPVPSKSEAVRIAVLRLREHLTKSDKRRSHGR